MAPKRINCVCLCIWFILSLLYALEEKLSICAWETWDWEVHICVDSFTSVSTRSTENCLSIFLPFLWDRKEGKRSTGWGWCDVMTNGHGWMSLFFLSCSAMLSLFAFLYIKDVTMEFLLCNFFGLGSKGGNFSTLELIFPKLKNFFIVLWANAAAWQFKSLYLA